jgi:hypothetical protein
LLLAFFDTHLFSHSLYQNKRKIIKGEEKKKTKNPNIPWIQILSFPFTYPKKKKKNPFLPVNVLLAASSCYTER